MKEFDFPVTVDLEDADDVSAQAVVEVEGGNYELVAVMVRNNQTGRTDDVLGLLTSRQQDRLIEAAIKIWEG